MPFSKVESFVDFPAVEREVLAFWDREDIFARLRRRNANGPRWSFLDGPIAANNPTLIVAGIVGLVVAATVALWAHYGTAVFFEMIRAGFVACFG